LKSKENDSFTVPFSIAKLSKLVENTVEEDDADDLDIPLPNVRTDVLKKVIEYCVHYAEEEMTPIKVPLKSNRIEETVQEWYAKYCDVEQNMLFELVTAANFMDIKPLLDLTCYAVSVMIKGKSADEMRSIFNISADLTPDEEQQVQHENQWASQPHAD
jgi:S-phase kinase-associated protein 1